MKKIEDGGTFIGVQLELWEALSYIHLGSPCMPISKTDEHIEYLVNDHRLDATRGLVLTNVKHTITFKEFHMELGRVAHENGVTDEVLKEIMQKRVGAPDVVDSLNDENKSVLKFAIFLENTMSKGVIR
jgi:hypothetical protein